MLTALSTALSALDAESTGIDVVGNNLSNLNTTGFKANTTIFDDLISQTEGASGATQVGMGVAPPTTERIFSQGATQASTSPLDVAIQGDGFLIVQPQNTTSTLYTRAGNLKTDMNGVLARRQRGQRTGLDSLTARSTRLPPLETSCCRLAQAVNLRRPKRVADYESQCDCTHLYVYKSADGLTFSTSVEVFDSKGQSYPLSMTFTTRAATLGRSAGS